jgi:hypothetical protein
MSKKHTNQKSKTFSSFSVPALLKLAQLEADERHKGQFTILAEGGEFKALYGCGAPAQAADVASHDSLKSALVNLLVDAPTFAESEFVTELPIQ